MRTPVSAAKPAAGATPTAAGGVSWDAGVLARVALGAVLRATYLVEVGGLPEGAVFSPDGNTPNGPVSGRTYGTPMPQPSVPSASVSATTPPNATAPADTVTPPAALYRWTDERGVANWTDQLYAVPERYRADARRHL